MYYEPGEHIDLTHLNDKPEKKGAFAAHLEDEKNDSWMEVGTQIMFMPVRKMLLAKSA